MKLESKIYKIFASLIIFTIIFFWNFTFENNEKIQNTTNIDQCIFKADYKAVTLSSMGQNFNIFYVENSPKKCINSYFPSINIRIADANIFWLQIVRTDSYQNEYRLFVDSSEDFIHYPFYSFGSDFYDAPLWNNRFYFKPLSFWKAHCYAVKLDRKNKKIKSLGGIAWGFNLSYLRFHPKMIQPSPLNLQNWEEDKRIFMKELPDYDFLP